MINKLFDPFQADFWATLGVSVLCGAIIGCERQFRGKPAGIRTSILICLSTAVFIRLSEAHSIEGADPMRVLGQLVTGVGFLGAGVMFSNNGSVTGVTTAAVIWILAGIGSAVGFGHLLAAVVLSILVVVILLGVELLESLIQRLAKGVYRRDSDKF